jgi:hypothetical protein
MLPTAFAISSNEMECCEPSSLWAEPIAAHYAHDPDSPLLVGIRMTDQNELKRSGQQNRRSRLPSILARIKAIFASRGVIFDFICWATIDLRCCSFLTRRQDTGKAVRAATV